jgi:hypothetical protein
MEVIQMPMDATRSSFVQHGERYVGVQSEFNRFIDAILPLAGEIPSLAFSNRDPTKIDFSFLGYGYRLRLEFDANDGVGRLVYMAKGTRDDENDKRYEPRNAVLINHAGDIGVNGAWPWKIIMHSEKVFYYLITGRK